MPWKDLDLENADLLFYKQMIDLYNTKPALHSGSFGMLDYSNPNILTFSRYTDKIDDYTVIVINTTDDPQEFQLISNESSLMNGSKMVEVSSRKKATIFNSMIYGKIDAHSFEIYEMEIEKDGYSPYKRL